MAAVSLCPPLSLGQFSHLPSSQQAKKAQCLDPSPLRLCQLSIPLYSHSGEVRSAFIPPLPDRGELYPPFMATSFVKEGAICPSAVLSYDSLRAGDVSCSPGRVADSLQQNWVSSSRAQVGKSLKFYVCMV
jgi:hypothetical protein